MRSSLLLLGSLFLPAILAAESLPAYQCIGFSAPMDETPLFIQRGRVLPLKAQVATTDGAVLDKAALSPPPHVRLAVVDENGQEKDISPEAQDFGSGEEFVAVKEQDGRLLWKYDLSTIRLESRSYVVRLISGDDSRYLVDPVCKATFTVRR